MALRRYSDHKRTARERQEGERRARREKEAKKLRATKEPKSERIEREEVVSMSDLHIELHNANRPPRRHLLYAALAFGAAAALIALKFALHNW